MLEIFVPQKIFWKMSLNTFEIKDLIMLKNAFSLNYEEFRTEIISWTVLKISDNDEDIFIFANWAFWKRYFYDFDYWESRYSVFWKSFYHKDNYFSDLKNIEKEIFYVKEVLESNNLLTNTKKEELRKKVEDVFFLISWVYFHLYSLLDETNENIFDLENIDWKIEYEATASLIIETSKTKKVELEAVISGFEEKIKMFYGVISKLFIN